VTWLESVERPGPLREAAERLFSDEVAPRGAAGLAWLIRRIDLHSQDERVTPASEAAFIESAGALLGLLLVEHVREGEHACRDGLHRVRLGRGGFVDPFGAIEAALGAESVRKTIIEFVAHAEAEARSEAGVGRASALFERMLAERRPDLEITDRFDRRVWLGPDVEVDLGRALDAAGASDASLRSALEKLVAMLPGGSDARLSREEAEGRLLPRLMRREVLAGRGVVLEPFCEPEVAVSLVLAYDGRSRFVRQDELAGWDLDVQTALRVSIGRLAERSIKARFARVDADEGPWVFARSRDGLDSARVLLPALHEVLSPDLGETFLLAVPHRDALYACADTPELERVIAARAADDFARAPHGVTPRVFRVDAARLSLARPTA
jgi:hypothetical protein